MEEQSVKVVVMGSPFKGLIKGLRGSESPRTDSIVRAESATADVSLTDRGRHTAETDPACEGAPAPPRLNRRALLSMGTAVAAGTGAVALLSSSPAQAVTPLPGRVGTVVPAAGVATAGYTLRNQTALARGAVVFTLDDGYSDALSLLDFHETLDQRVALAITCGWIGQPGKMTAEQVLDACVRGHEIANHSTSHADYVTLTPDQRATETDTCSDWIQGLTGQRPSTFAYPFGSWNAACDQELYSRFRSWGVTLSPTTNLPSWTNLGDSFPRFYRVDIENPANLNRAMALVRKAAASPIIVSFYSHQIDRPGISTVDQYRTVAQLAYDLSVPTVLPRDVFGSAGIISDPSFEEPGIPTWFASSTGTAASSDSVTALSDAGMFGTKVLALTATSGSQAVRSQAIPVTESVIYRLAGRIRIASGNLLSRDIELSIKWRNANEEAISETSFYPNMGSTWSRFETDVTAPAKSRFGYLNCILAPGSARSGTVYLDHIDIRVAGHGSLG
ncbi:hypothetical protein E5206_06190 [Arthrobacter sp. PAMC25564]|nr:hypothetical protein E5206_06190 [Arthrobacter sp. PAMC25564]